MPGRKILILELGEKVIKVCRAQVSSRRKIIDLLKVWGFPAAITPEDVQRVLAEVSFKVKYEKIIVSFSRASFLIRFLKLPSKKREEMRQMLAFILTKKIVYPLAEIIYDFSLVEVQEGYSKVLIFIIPRDKVEDVSRTLKTSSRQLNFTISSAGLLNWLAYQQKFSKERMKYPVIVVDRDKEKGELLVVDKGDVIFSRAFDVGGEGDIQEGISQSLKIFRKELFPASFPKIIFTGKGKPAGLTSYEGIEAVSLDDKANFSFTTQVKGEVRKSDCSFASVLGLAVGDTPQFDFSPAGLKRKQESIRRRRRNWRLAAALLEVVLIGGIFLGKYVWDRYSQQKFLAVSLVRLKVPVKELGVIEGKLRLFHKEFVQPLAFGQILKSVVT